MMLLYVILIYNIDRKILNFRQVLNRFLVGEGYKEEKNEREIIYDTCK